MEIIIPLVVLWVIFAFVTASIAKSKGRDYAAWWVAGLLLGIIGLIWSAALPTQGRGSGAASVIAPAPHATGGRCPFCAEAIQPEAIVCRWCGRDLPQGPVMAEASLTAPSRRPPSSTLVLAVLLVVVGVVVVLLNYGGALPGGTQDNYMYLGLGVVAVGVVWTIALLLARRRDPSRG